jgi:radical SAM-linked protein
LDTRRTLVRFGYAKGEEAAGFDDGDIHTIFLLAFGLEGLGLALDLGKRPRPLLSVGLPLPVGVCSDVESMDLVLKREPMEEARALLERLNRRLPAGLSIHRWDLLPTYASPLCDLALLSRWQWRVPAPLRDEVADRAANFHAVEQLPWQRDPSKPASTLDLRHLVPELEWRGDSLCFATRMGPFQAINPLKVLGALMGLEAPIPGAVTRTSLDLRPDPRLDQADRFEPKLKNMYEDAVLLGGASNITLVDEDDDEPLLLG